MSTIVNKKRTIILATCYRCGHKFNIENMAQVGNDTYECHSCLGKLAASRCK